MLDAFKRFMICCLWCIGILLAGAEHDNLPDQMIINFTGLSLFIVASIQLMNYKKD